MKKQKEFPNAIDVLVGRRVRQARLEARMTQQVLAKHIERTFQQLQKYETGANRISPGVLFIVSKATNKPIQWFFDASQEDLNPDRRVVRVVNAWKFIEGKPQENIMLALLESFKKE